MLRDWLCLSVATLISGLAFASDAHATFWCSEPSKPSCVNLLGYSRDQYTFDACRSDVERYIRNIKGYQKCLRDEINEKADEANRVIKQFNCHTRGDSIC